MTDLYSGLCDTPRLAEVIDLPASVEDARQLRLENRRLRSAIRAACDEFELFEALVGFDFDGPKLLRALALTGAMGTLKQAAASPPSATVGEG